MTDWKRLASGEKEEEIGEEQESSRKMVISTGCKRSFEKHALGLPAPKELVRNRRKNDSAQIPLPFAGGANE